MIVGAAVIPTAPLLVPGVSASLPDGIGRVADAVDHVLDGLPRADAVILVAAGSAGQAGVQYPRTASLAGIGRPGIVADLTLHHPLATAIGDRTGCAARHVDALALDLAVLALLVGTNRPVVPVLVSPRAAFAELAAVGDGIARAVADTGTDTGVVAAGDLSAGMTVRSPAYEIPGAKAWEDQAVDAVDSGRLDGLQRLGPDEALRVQARAWAPLAVLHGVCARARLGLVVRHHSAPRGVGYLVAYGR